MLASLKNLVAKDALFTHLEETLVNLPMISNYISIHIPNFY